MLLEGVRLMVVGMTTVFAFLGILVLAMHANRAIAQAIAPEEPPLEPSASPVADDDAAIAVVLAAVAARRGGQA
ncbi:MAG: OadG family protein [Myxococcota bacterium]